MTARTSPAARMLARARAASAYARRTGCGVDEADDILREAAVTRRTALTGAGTAALGLALPAALGQEHSVNFQGYMEGALRSGYRCANEIRA